MFYMAMAAIIAGVLFAMNDTEWFKGENGIAIPLIVIGTVIVVAQIIMSLIAIKRFNRATDDIQRRFRL